MLNFVEAALDITCPRLEGGGSRWLPAGFDYRTVLVRKTFTATLLLWRRVRRGVGAEGGELKSKASRENRATTREISSACPVVTNDSVEM